MNLLVKAIRASVNYLDNSGRDSASRHAVALGATAIFVLLCWIANIAKHWIGDLAVLIVAVPVFVLPIWVVICAVYALYIQED